MKARPMAYMKAESSKHGTFLGDEDGARAGRKKMSALLALRFRGEQLGDTSQTKGPAYRATKHDPITFVRKPGPSTSQFLSHLWNNEPLKEVEFEVVRYDSGEQEQVYLTIKLTNVKVVHVEVRCGKTAEWCDGNEVEPTLENIGLVPEKIEFKVKDEGGDAIANYDKNTA